MERKIDVRASFLVILVCLCNPAPALAQTIQVTAGGGLSAGDGGAAPAVVGSAGFLTDRRIGFELEFGFTPGLDFLGPDVIIQTESPLLSIFPPPFFEVTGDLFTFHTNLLFQFPASGRLRVIAVAGGGVANLGQRVRFRRGEIVLPLSPDVAVAPLIVPPIDIDQTISRTGLSLNAGGTIEFAWTERLGVGIDARYVHVFLDDSGLDVARVLGRMSWRF